MIVNNEHISRCLQKLGIDRPNRNQVTLMAKYLNACNVKRLSSRERELLYWAAQGRSVKEIARILDLKATTVRSYFDNIRRKFNARTVAQVIFEVVSGDYSIFLQ